MGRKMTLCIFILVSFDIRDFREMSLENIIQVTLDQMKSVTLCVT